MEVVGGNTPLDTLLPGDPRLIDHIVCELKSQGIFDQFRRDCIADVDTKPAYQNLRQRVEGSVNGFLNKQIWKPDMNKNQLREMLRKNIYESGFLETGVERIVDQVVNPKINTVFLPQVEEVVYKFLGLQKPSRNIHTNKNGPLSIDTVDLLPTDLDPISPDSEVLDKTLNKSNETEKMDESKGDDDESPPFEPLNDTVFSQHDESTNDSHLSGISGLTSHESHGSRPETPNKNYFTIPEMSNQDSQLSKVSSTSRLSIVTTEDKTTDKMDVCDDTSKTGDGSNSNKTENGYTSNFNIKDQIDVIATENTNGDGDKNTMEIEMDISDSNDKTEITEPDSVIKSDKLNETKPENKDDIKEGKSHDSRDKTRSSDSDKRRSSSKHESKDRKNDRRSSKDRKSDSRSKDKTSRSSSSSKDKYRDSSKDNKSRSNKDDKDSKSRSKSSSSKHRSRSKERRSRSKERKSRSKERSSSSKTKDSKERSRSSKSESKNDSKRSDNSKSSQKSDEKKSDASRSSDKKSSSSSKNSHDKKYEDSKSNDSKSNDSKSNDSKTGDSKGKSEESKPKSDDSKSHSRSGESKSRSRSESKSSKDRKLSSSSSRDKDRKDLRKPKNDDHYSLKSDKSKTDRRSTDRDSNDGSSNVGMSSNKDSNSSSKNSKSSDTSSFSGSNSGGDSGGQSDKIEQNVEQTDPKNSESSLGMKIKKPRFASNIFEARKLIKIRKKMEKMEKKRLMEQSQTENTEITTDEKISTDTGGVKSMESGGSEEVHDVVIDKPISVISKASWDAIEAQINLNIDYDSYIDENADESCSSIKSEEKDKTPKRKSTDEEDCLYFHPEMSPTTERFFKEVDNLKRSMSIENILESKRNRKPNRKYSTTEYDTDANEETGESSDSKKKKGMKRKTDDIGDDTDNNNKKIHILGDVSNVELEEDFSGFNNANISPVVVKPKKIHHSPENEMTDIQKVLRKANEERDALVQHLIQPIRSNRGNTMANQRYSSDDLYKPRPLFPGTRRTRGIANNADKSTEDTSMKRR